MQMMVMWPQGRITYNIHGSLKKHDAKVVPLEELRRVLWTKVDICWQEYGYVPDGPVQGNILHGPCELT